MVDIISAGVTMFNKRTLISILMLGVVVSIASAGTWAYFDSSQSVTSNSITTGRLGFEIINLAYNNQPQLVPMTAVNAIPGDEDVRLNPIPTYVRNTGSIDGVLSLEIIPDASDNGELSENLVVKVSTSPYPGSGTVVTLWNKGPTGSKEIRDLDVGDDDLTLYYIYSFPDTGSPQNELQGEIFKFNVKYSLVQK